MDDATKKKLLKVTTGEEWNDFVKENPGFSSGGLDKECIDHINNLVRSNARKEILENPDTHYEAF